MEKDRPSLNMGKFRTTKARRGRYKASEADLSLFGKITPTRPSCLTRLSHSLRSLAQGSAISPFEGRGSSEPSSCQSSEVKPMSLSSGIEGFLEGLRPQPPVDLEERLLLADADRKIGVDNLIDRVGHLVGCEAWADDLTNGGAFRRGTAKRDLVELLAPLIEAENADVADMMMAAGIDAARDVDLERPDLLLPGKVGKTPGDALGDWYGSRGRQCTIVKTGAGYDVAGKTQIGRGQPVRLEYLPDFVESAAFDVRQN